MFKICLEENNQVQPLNVSISPWKHQSARAGRSNILMGQKRSRKQRVSASRNVEGFQKTRHCVSGEFKKTKSHTGASPPRQDDNFDIESSSVEPLSARLTWHSPTKSRRKKKSQLVAQENDSRSPRGGHVILCLAFNNSGDTLFMCEKAQDGLTDNFNGSKRFVRARRRVDWRDAAHLLFDESSSCLSNKPSGEANTPQRRLFLFLLGAGWSFFLFPASFTA